MIPARFQSRPRGWRVYMEELLTLGIILPLHLTLLFVFLSSVFSVSELTEFFSFHNLQQEKFTLYSTMVSSHSSEVIFQASANNII